MASTLESYVNRMVSIITADGRNFIGTLKGFDQTINLILDDTHERIYSPNQGVEQVSEQRGWSRNLAGIPEQAYAITISFVERAASYGLLFKQYSLKQY